MNEPFEEMGETIMKKGGILNCEICALIGSVGHGDMIMVSDAGFAVPQGVKRIELALEQNSPTVERVLELLYHELIIEKYIVAKEMPDVNPLALEKYRGIFLGTTIKEEQIPHGDIVSALAPECRAVIRTGAFSPYGSIILFPAIDALEWYKAPGVSVPDFYKERINAAAKA